MLSSSSNTGGTPSELGKLVLFLLAIVATVVVLSLSSTNDFDDDNVVVQNASLDARELLENVPEEGTAERMTFCAKVANVGEWVHGDKACERVKMDAVFAHTFGACAFEKDFGRQKKTFGFGGGLSNGRRFRRRR